jgi:hypothetical protein
MEIFVALAAGAADCFSPPHAAASAASIRASDPGNLERCQVMERDSLRMWGWTGRRTPPGTILHPKSAPEKEPGVADAEATS